MSKSFAKISSILPDDSTTWDNQLFLTFDVDWCIDEVLAATIDIVEKADIAATWFVTHNTPLLKRLRDNPKFELGIHPNFNKLLFESDESNGATPEEIVSRLLEIVPEAISVRSHSVTQSRPLLDLFQNYGLTHDCNPFIPWSAGAKLKPWSYWRQIIEVPYGWEDGIHLLNRWKKNTIAKWLDDRPQLRVFDFHPIHVQLNTTSFNIYDETRPFHRNWQQLKAHQCQGFGARSHLELLLNQAPVERLKAAL